MPQYSPKDTPNGAALRRRFERARDVRPSAITGKETPHDIVMSRFPAYVGRQERTAYELMRRSIEQDCAVFLTLSGAMTPAGLHQSCLIPLVERGLEFQKKMTTPELHHRLGRRLAELEKALGVKEPSLLATAYKHGVPVFVGAVQDGSIFLNMVKLKRLLGDEFTLEIDVNDDVFEMGAVQHHCFATLARPMAVWIL